MTHVDGFLPAVSAAAPGLASVPVQMAVALMAFRSGLLTLAPSGARPGAEAGRGSARCSRGKRPVLFRCLRLAIALKSRWVASSAPWSTPSGSDAERGAVLRSFCGFRGDGLLLLGTERALSESFFPC